MGDQYVVLTLNRLATGTKSIPLPLAQAIALQGQLGRDSYVVRATEDGSHDDYITVAYMV